MLKKLALLIAFLVAATAAQARVHSVPVFQTLAWPLGGEFPNFLAEAVAIDGDSIIVLVDTSQEDTPTITRVALLYRRGTDSRWTYSRTLTQVTAPRAELRAELAMKNNLAVIKIHRDIATVWEKTGGSWVQGSVPNGLREPGGFAISGNSILAGSSGCVTDGLIFQKSTVDGSWLITGRIPNQAGVCANLARAVELNYDYAFIRSSPTLVRSYRKNGTSIDWVANRTLNLTGQAAESGGPIAVQLGVAVTPGSAYFTRGTNWNHAGQLIPIDYASGTGEAGKVIFRDGVVVTSEGWDEPRSPHTPYVYVANGAGGFDHVATLQGGGTFNTDFDISGRTIVSAGGTDFGSIQGFVSVHVLPETLVSPPAIANNFDSRDISGFTLSSGSGFSLAGNSSNYLFRQAVGARDTAAVFTSTDWRGFQYIEADVTPGSYDLSESWNGVAVRYVDENNYYFAGVTQIATFVIGRKVNGVFTILAEEDVDVLPASTHQIGLSINGSQLIASLSGSADAYLQAEDASLTHGRAALATHRARADFDNTYVAPTAARRLFSQEYPFWVFGRPLTYLGGNWRVGTGETEAETGLLQTDTAGNAFAIVPGLAIDNQSVTTDAVLDAFGSTSPVAWFGIVLRYVDQRNYYYLSIRSSNQLQIRKVVNGAVTVLKAVTLTITPGSTHRYDFEVRGNELRASVDGNVLARAVDSSLARGQYGLATYRASARYKLVSASQP
jgi:hypothetical protein